MLTISIFIYAFTTVAKTFLSISIFTSHAFTSHAFTSHASTSHAFTDTLRDAMLKLNSVEIKF